MYFFTLFFSNSALLFSLQQLYFSWNLLLLITYLQHFSISYLLSTNSFKYQSVGENHSTSKEQLKIWKNQQNPYSSALV